jgi:hypothetical protein
LKPALAAGSFAFSLRQSPVTGSLLSLIGLLGSFAFFFLDSLATAMMVAGLRSSAPKDFQDDVFAVCLFS